MVFDERLKILREGKVIPAEVEAALRRVISRLEEQWGIALTEKTGGRMVTHLAMALARISRKEDILPPDTELLEEFKNTDCFSQAVSIVEDLIHWTPFLLPEAEQDYLIINICLILDGQHEG